MTDPARTLVVWCPDWPIVAVGTDPDQPVAVLRANRVVASSTGARRRGVVRGLRRRSAQRCCPDLVLHDRDEDREARLFEPVVAALDEIAHRIEVIRPGVCSFRLRGPARYFGGEEKVTQRTVERLQSVVDGRTRAVVGVADGPFAAGLAARTVAAGDNGSVRRIPVGETAEFLAPLSIGVLDQPELVDVLRRLGLTTLGSLAALPAADVLARFGLGGQAAHRLARGLDEHPPSAYRAEVDWSVVADVDPPADRIDRAAFAARSLADQLHRRLAEEGVTCLRVGIHVETEYGEERCRFWRHEGALSDAAVADRVRWQLDGWLNGPAGQRPSGGITRLTLIPEGVVAARGRQLGFWGGESERDRRAARVAARLQGQLGSDAVLVPEYQGGRHPGDHLRLVPASTVELVGRRLRPQEAPWPGALSAPSPTRVPLSATPIEVLDDHGDPVAISGRGMLSSGPVTIGVGRRRMEVKAWAGPWPVDERWWDPEAHERQARLQVITSDGRALLVALKGGRWSITAEWD